MGRFTERTVLIIIVVLGFHFFLSQAHGASDASYSYRHQGQLVVLTPAPGLAAIKNPRRSAQAAQYRISDDKNAGLRTSGYEIFRFPQQDHVEAMRAAKSLGGDSQPVFLAGEHLFFPAQEVTIGLHKDLAPAAALERLRNAGADYLISARAHTNAKTVIVGIASYMKDAFEAARRLDDLQMVRYAEPNFAFLRLADPMRELYGLKERQIEPEMVEDILSRQRATYQADPERFHIPPKPVDPRRIFSRNPQAAEFKATQAPGRAQTGWSNIREADFEQPFDPFTTVWFVDQTVGNASQYVWGRTNYRSWRNNYSLWCAGANLFGGAGLTPPNSADNSMATIFYTTADLRPYEEVYVDCYFWTDNQISLNNNQLGVFDAPTLMVANLNSPFTTFEHPLWAVSDAFINEPTAVSGWRHVVYRIPPALRGSAISITFLWTSNFTAPTKGCFLDSIFVLGTTNVDVEPISNDPYSARMVAHKNTGQIAAWGNDTNDMNTPQAWAELPGGQVDPNLVVAVVDDGVELTHPDLNIVPGYTVGGIGTGGPASNQANHGTACAGCCGAIGGNGLGGVGAAPGVKIMPINYSAGGFFDVIPEGINWALDNGADILSNSWGSSGLPPVQAVTDVLNRALGMRVPVFIAAGNGPDRAPWSYATAFPGSLADVSNVITIGATGPWDDHKNAASSDGVFSWGSSYLPNPFDGRGGPTVCALGPWNYTTDRLGSLGYNSGTGLSDQDFTHDFGGTSSATPIAAGVAALMLTVNPDLSPGQIKSILEATAVDIGAVGRDEPTGYGRIDALAAVQMAKSTPAGGASGRAGLLLLLSD